MEVSSNNVILVDQYLENAKEIDVDLIRDSSGDIYIAGIMEHIEEAGIHSGDSACSLPPYSINQSTQDLIKDWVSKIANKIICSPLTISSIGPIKKLESIDKIQNRLN